MAIRKGMFSNPDNAVDVVMPEPLDCVFSLRPLKPDTLSTWNDKAGLTVSGKTKDGGIQYRDHKTEKTVLANRWLLRKIVAGWQGLQTIDEDGCLEDVEFNDKNLDTLSQYGDIVSLIMEKAMALAGTVIEEEEKN